MKHDDVIPILYEMAMAIGSEISLNPLLTRTLQRILYFTSFPVGIICLDLPSAEGADSDFLSVKHIDASNITIKLIIFGGFMAKGVGKRYPYAG